MNQVALYKLTNELDEFYSQGKCSNNYIEKHLALPYFDDGFHIDKMFRTPIYTLNCLNRIN